ncbi:nuclear transport factor 2 family protein [Spongisporangium articulatum]|uniref:Nuclear transport factor 2 family protein n=1 Tax=Spongisporangium articulatum TaxID=3362603 RepID=A0ABW8APT3_9ACTN
MTLGTREVIDAIFADAATGDVADVMRWWHPDGVLEDVTLARAYRGHDEIADYLTMYYAALPDVVYEPVRLVVEGPTAVVEWAQPAVVSGTFDGVPADGRRLYLHAVDVFHVVDGLIVHESSWYGDGWLRQRLEGATMLPDPLPLTPPAAGPGVRF